jgi:hypothetical protein
MKYSNKCTVFTRKFTSSSDLANLLILTISLKFLAVFHTALANTQAGQIIFVTLFREEVHHPHAIALHDQGRHALLA